LKTLSIKPYRHRPSKLTKSLINRAYDYLNGDWRDVGDHIPSLSGLACYLGVCNKTIFNYSKQNDDFLHITTMVMTMQENRLINGGLAGEFNPTITKLLLSKHGYHDKVQNEINSINERVSEIILIGVEGRESDDSFIKNEFNKLRSN
jgi:hypothetical protein